MENIDRDNNAFMNLFTPGIYHCYRHRLSLNKTSTVIGWFLVTYPWIKFKCIPIGIQSAVVARALRRSRGKHQDLEKIKLFPSGLYIKCIVTPPSTLSITPLSISWQGQLKGKLQFALFGSVCGKQNLKLSQMNKGVSF